MAVYLAVENPLHFANREAANKWYQKNAVGIQTIVPFRLNTKTTLEARKIDVQLAKSAFGGLDADAVLARAIEIDSTDNIQVYYVNKKRSHLRSTAPYVSTEVSFPTGSYIL